MTPYDRNNIFARILRGEAPCTKVFEDEHALALAKQRGVALIAAREELAVAAPAWTDGAADWKELRDLAEALPPFSTKAAQAAAEALAAQLDAVKSDLEKTEVRAPVAGPVLEKYLSDERPVLPGTPLMKIGDPATLEIESDVLSEEVGRVQIGAKVELLGRAFGGEQHKDTSTNMGTVKRVYPSAFMKISALGVEQQRVKVLIDLDAAKDAKAPPLRPGTRLDVHIITGEKQNALAIPERAAFRRHGQWYVFKVIGGAAKLTPVSLGLKNDTSAEVTDGLAEGDTLVTEPMNELTDGAPVTVRETAG